MSAASIQKNHELRKSTTQAVNEFFGTKFCKVCRSHKSVNIMTELRDSLGRPKPTCLPCYEAARDKRRRAENLIFPPAGSSNE
jgi:hypothetical protein